MHGVFGSFKDVRASVIILIKFNYHFWVYHIFSPRITVILVLQWKRGDSIKSFEKVYEKINLLSPFCFLREFGNVSLFNLCYFQTFLSKFNPSQRFCVIKSFALKWFELYPKKYNSIGYPCLTHTSVSHNRIKQGDDTTILKVRLNEMQNLKGGVWTFRWLGRVCGLTAAVTVTLQIFNIKHKSLLGFQREQKMEKLLNAKVKYGRFIYSDSFHKSSVYMVSWSV